jgi:hypothetical protein
MTRSSHPRRMIRRSLLVATTVGGLMLASMPLASAATTPAPGAIPGAVTGAAPVPSLPIVGGLVDSAVGITTGTLYGISGAASAVVCPLVTPVCSLPPL